MRKGLSASKASENSRQSKMMSRLSIGRLSAADETQLMQEIQYLIKCTNVVQAQHEIEQSELMDPEGQPDDQSTEYNRLKSELGASRRLSVFDKARKVNEDKHIQQ